MPLIEFLKNTLAPIGSKITGAIHTIGSKISHAGRSAVDFINKIPLLKDVARPITDTASGVLDVVQGVADVSGSISKALRSASSDDAAGHLNNAISTGQTAAEKARSILRKRD